MKKILLLFAFAAVCLPALAAPKIAVADLEKVFKEYYKSKIAEDVIRQQSDVYRAYLLKLRDEVRKLEEEYKVARDGAQNLALNETARREFEALAARKTEEVAAKRAEAEKYAVEKNNQMRELELAKRREIIADIRNEIKRRAAAEGLDLVLDASGRTSNDVSAVLYANPAMDLTAELIKALNAAAVTPAEKR